MKPRLKIDQSIFKIPENIAVTGRIKSWLSDLQQTVDAQDETVLDTLINKFFGYKVDSLRRLPVSCTVYVVGDSMDEVENSIEHSWLYASHGLRNGAGVAIHLSNLRPKNTPNGNGLVSSGPVSFAQIYSKLNEILRRGGTFRNGAVTLHLDADHPDIVEFATASRELLPWARRAINIDNDFINHPQLELLLKTVETGDCFLVKKQYDKDGNRVYHNVCVSGDTLVKTTKGDISVKDLVGVQFTTILRGKEYNSTEQGFWSNGKQPVFKLTTKTGISVKATADHKFKVSTELTQNGTYKEIWVELQNLRPTDLISLNSFDENSYIDFIESIEYVGIEEVFDCTINDAHAFDANGLIAHNCLEITCKHTETCLLAHCNLGATKIEEIIPTFVKGMEWLCTLHEYTGVHLSGYYQNPKKDRQVGLGVLGLANLLAIEGITYENLVRGMENVLNPNDQKATSYKAQLLAETLYTAFQQAGALAEAKGFERCFTVAPTANCSFKHRDREFYTTTPEIAPPVDISVERDSQTMGVIEVDYHPDCEIASDVGWDTYFRLNCAWQGYMNSTGLAHAISTNWWSDKVAMDKNFVEKFLESPLKSIYYAWQVSPLVQDKSEVLTPDIICNLSTQESAYNTQCTSCME